MSPGQTGHITGQMGRVPGTDGTHTRGCPTKILYVYWFFFFPIYALRWLGARDSNQDPLVNRIARNSRDLKSIFKNAQIVKTSQRIEQNLGLRLKSCDFKSLRIGAVRSAANCAPRFGTSKFMQLHFPCSFWVARQHTVAAFNNVGSIWLIQLQF